MKEVEVDQDPGVELRDELVSGFEEVALGNGDDLIIGKYIHNLGARQPRVLEFRHSSTFPLVVRTSFLRSAGFDR